MQEVLSGKPLRGGQARAQEEHAQRVETGGIRHRLARGKRQGFLQRLPRHHPQKPGGRGREGGTGRWTLAQQSFQRLAVAIRQLRQGRFDLAIDLSGGDRGAFLALASGARLRAGFAPRKPSPRARVFHRLADPRGTQNHVVETLLRPVQSLGLTPGLPGLSLRPSPEAQARAAEILARHGLKPRGYALVHPTSRWMFKTWTPEGNAWVIRRLLALGLGVVLTAAPEAKEMAFEKGGLIVDQLGKSVVN